MRQTGYIIISLFFICCLQPLQIAAQKTNAILAQNYSNHLRTAKGHGTPAFKSSTQIKSYSAKRKLVKVNSGTGYKIGKLDYSMPYLIPKAKSVLTAIGKSFYTKSGKKYFVVTSLIRTTAAQSKLQRVNRNAKHGLSSHNYGCSFDISYVRFNGKKARNARLERILESVLQEYQRKGKIYVIKERYVSCYHITVRS